MRTRLTRAAASHIVLLLFAVAVAGYSAGCDDGDGVYFPTNECSGERAELATEWRLSFAGHRSGCRDGGLNGSFRLVNDLDFTINSLPDRETENESALLGVMDDVPAGTEVVLEGRLIGQCVTLELEERPAEGSSGGTVTYSFVGEINQDGDILGIFSGRGPHSCQTDGSFYLDQR